MKTIGIPWKLLHAACLSRRTVSGKPMLADNAAQKHDVYVEVIAVMQSTQGSVQ